MKAMVGLVLAILVIFGIRLFWPTSEPEISNLTQNEIHDESVSTDTETTSASSDDSGNSSLSLNAPNDAEKTRLMRAEYEVLEDSRHNLKRHIAKLKHDMWGLKFPSATAKKISHTVMGASKLLKNPHMLGAFSSVEQIKDEVAKVEFAEKSLEEIDEIIKLKVEEKSAEIQSNSAIQ
jgi:hypothetical protein